MIKTNIVGQKFTRLTVLEFSHIDPRYEESFWKCSCDCGTIVFIRNSNLKSGNTKSCGCYKTRRASKDVIVNSIYTTYSLGAKKRNYEFAITKDQLSLIIKQNCYYCNKQETNTRKQGNHIYTYNGIDRIDNSKGYTLDNIVPCCKFCNRMKSAYSKKEFLDHVKSIAKHLKLV